MTTPEPKTELNIRVIERHGRVVPRHGSYITENEHWIVNGKRFNHEPSMEEIDEAYSAPVDTASHESGVILKETPEEYQCAYAYWKTAFKHLNPSWVASLDELLRAGLASLSAPKAGQVDVEALKAELCAKVQDPKWWQDTSMQRMRVEDTRRGVAWTIDHLSTQGYFDKPIAGLRERILDMKIKEFRDYGSHVVTKGESLSAFHAHNAAIDAVIELIDGGA